MGTDLTKLIEDWKDSDQPSIGPILLVLAKRIDAHEDEIRILKERYELESKIAVAVFEAAVSGGLRKKS